MDRRGFMQKGMRLAMTGALLAAAGYLVASGRVSSSAVSAKDCSPSGSCGNCRWAAKCEKKEKQPSHGR